MGKKCKCGKEVFTEVYIAGEDLSSPVCIDCLEQLIKDNKVYWCIYHRRYELYEEGKLTHMAKIKNTRGLICDCISYQFMICRECGELAYEDDICNEICRDCMKEKDVENTNIGGYHNQHDFPKKLYGNPLNGIFFGLEIESEYSLDSSLNEDEEVSFQDERPSIEKMFSESTRTLCCFERDGSLEDGFETITNPLSYEFMKNNGIIEQITSELKKIMYVSDRCGLHIHVTKTDEVVKKLPQIIMFLENNKKDVIDFCGRETPYAEFYTYKDKKIDTRIANEIIFSSESFGRRRMINLTNKDTIEFRGFKGTLDANRIYKYIEFILALLETDINENTTFKDLVIPDLLNHA